MKGSTQADDNELPEKLCPNCFQTNWEHTSKNPGAVMCRCNDCEHSFPAAEAVEEGTRHEAGFHNDPAAWSK